MDARGKNKWTKCFEVSNVILPTGYHLGFSAATGQLADNHDIIMLKTYEVDLVDGQEYNREVCNARVQNNVATYCCQYIALSFTFQDVDDSQNYNIYMKGKSPY